MGRHQHAMPSGPGDPSLPWTDSAEIPAAGSTTVRFPTRPGRHVAFDEPLDARRSPVAGHASTGPSGRRSASGPPRRREGHAGGNHPGESHAAGNHPGESHAGEGRADGNPPGADRPGGNRPGESRAGEGRPGDGGAGGNHPGDSRAADGWERTGNVSTGPASGSRTVVRRTPVRAGSVAAPRRRVTDGGGSTGDRPGEETAASSGSDGDPAPEARGGDPAPDARDRGTTPGGPSTEPSEEVPAGRLPPGEIPTRDLPVRVGTRNGSVRTRRTGEAGAESSREVPATPGRRARRFVVTGPIEVETPALPVRPRSAGAPKRTVVEPDPDRPDLDTLRRVLAALHRL